LILAAGSAQKNTSYFQAFGSKKKKPEGVIVAIQADKLAQV
jgi:hypothetical protein